MPSPEKERAADESETNAKQATGIWVRFVGTPGSGSFGRNQTPPKSLPKWVCFFDSQTQRDAMTEHPPQHTLLGSQWRWTAAFWLLAPPSPVLVPQLSWEIGHRSRGGPNIPCASRLRTHRSGTTGILVRFFDSNTPRAGFVPQKPIAVVIISKMGLFFRIPNSTSRYDRTSPANPRC